MATAGWDKTARIWNVDTFKQTLVVSKFFDCVLTVEFSADGYSIITQELEGDKAEWDAVTGAPIRILVPVKQSYWETKQLSPDGRRLVRWPRDKPAQLCDANGKIISVLGDAEIAVFSPHSRRLFTYNLNNTTANLWDTESGHKIASLSGQACPVYSAKFSPDEAYLATAKREDMRVHIWNSTDGTDVAQLSGHNWGINEAVFMPDGESIATADWEGNFNIWRKRRPPYAWESLPLPNK